MKELEKELQEEYNQYKQMLNNKWLSLADPDYLQEIHTKNVMEICNHYFFVKKKLPKVSFPYSE